MTCYVVLHDDLGWMSRFSHTGYTVCPCAWERMEGWCGISRVLTAGLMLLYLCDYYRIVYKSVRDRSFGKWHRLSAYNSARLHHSSWRRVL